jgi:hypothetical protein
MTGPVARLLNREDLLMPAQVMVIPGKVSMTAAAAPLWKRNKREGYRGHT